VDDPFDLERFVAAQDQAGIYQQALDELRRGRKQTHWMWFVFPQIAGLGQSAMATRYGIGSLEEAQAYMSHPVLGPRMVESAGVVAASEGRTAVQIFGGIDAQKLRSSMTLFMRAEPQQGAFRAVLERFFGGSPDPLTDGRL